MRQRVISAPGEASAAVGQRNRMLGWTVRGSRQLCLFVLLAILLLALIPQGAFFGVDRLLTSVRENVGRSARQIRDAIIADVDAFVDNAPQRDDIALVVLARDSKQDSDRVTNDE